MGKNKRWGKKYKDKRDWPTYNEKLVNRGEYYINPKFLQTWNPEIKEMNNNKVGNPYLYPESLIEFLAILKEKGFKDRDLEGILRGLSKNMNNFPVISYSQINRRINALDIQFSNEYDNKLIVGIDGTGHKVTNRGDWMRHVWKVKRGWIKIVIMGTIDGKIVDVRVGTEKYDERNAGRIMIKKHKDKIKKVLADGLHDCNETFDLCEKLGIDTAIKIRENASKKGLGRRPREVRKYKKKGYKKWAKEKKYGMRWPATEGIFSAEKRIFGECITATKKANMYKQAKRKFWAYNKLIQNC